jgi:hypothetical protein
MIGRQLDLTRHYIIWDRDIVNEPIVRSAAGGRIPFIALQAKRQDGSLVKWSDIATGVEDATIEHQAGLLRELDHQVYFAFNHEPENDPAGSPQDYRDAFDHIKSVFTAQGVTKIHHVATLMRGTYQGARGGAHQWMPEGADLVGADGYNRGACNPGIGWESFESIFDAAHAFAVDVGKPMALEEWGCVEADDCGGSEHTSKAHWLLGAGSTIRSWPEVAVVVYTNSRADYGGKAVDFRVDTSPASLAAYRHVGNEPHFN